MINHLRLFKACKWYSKFTHPNISHPSPKRISSNSNRTETNRWIHVHFIPQFTLLIFAWYEMGSYFNTERKKQRKKKRLFRKNWDLINERRRWHWIYYNLNVALPILFALHYNMLTDWTRVESNGKKATHHERNPSRKSHNLNVFQYDAFEGKKGRANDEMLNNNNNNKKRISNIVLVTIELWIYE